MGLGGWGAGGNHSDLIEILASSASASKTHCSDFDFAFFS